MHVRRLITATLTAAAFIVLTPSLATPGTWWEGQWNPNVRLDTAQVAAGPQCQIVGTDAMGLDTCDPVAVYDPEVPNGEDPADWQPHGDVTDDAGVRHTGCESLPALPDLDLPEVIVCSDGWTSQP
jgi:hypothetical protein